jgi:sulfide:quinone oxidoreductase
MKPVVVSDRLAVGEVPTPEQMEILAKAGFKSVINNQPDGEVDRLPGNAVLGEVARRCGLGYAHAPLASRTPNEGELAAFADALAQLPAPIYGFCYSGARSAAGCALLLTEALEPDAIIAQFAAADFDIAALRPWLEDERKRRAPGGRQTNGSGRGPAVETRPPAAMTVPKPLEGIVVHARAMGNGGFAM